MDAFDAYKIYIALKSHFNSDYDFNKYHGKTSVTLDSFLKRSDRSFFGRVGRKYKDDTKQFFISNFISDPKGWIGNFDDVTYVEYQKRQQKLRHLCLSIWVSFGNILGGKFDVQLKFRTRHL